jgi:hypothetical protein
MDAADSRVPPSGPLQRIGASSQGWRAPGPALQGLLALAIYLAAFAWYAVPLIRYLNMPVIGHASPDSNFYIWSLRWLPYAISHGLNPLYSNQIMAPGGISLAWSTPAPTAVIVMWPVTAAFGPVLSYNLTLLLVPPATGWAAFVAARRLTGRFWASLLGGAVYGFCPFMVMHNARGDLNLTVNMLFPLMVYLVLLWRDGTLGRTGFVIWMTVALALQFYTFTEFFADMTVLLAAALVIGYAVAGHAGRRTVAQLAALTAMAYAGALVLASPYLIYALQRYPSELTRQQSAYSLRIVRLILPSSDRLFGLRSLVAYSNGLGPYSIDEYVGLPLLVILLLLAVFTWKSRVTRLLVSAFFVVVALAAGPNLIIADRPAFALPWGGLWSLPIARSAEPLRFIIFGFLILAIALALWLAAPAASRLAQAARWALGVLALTAILADLPMFNPAVVPLPDRQVPAAAAMRPVGALPAFITDGLYRQYLKPGEIVVVVSQRGNAGMLFQADSGFYFRIAGGYVNMSLSQQDPQPVTALTHPTRDTVRQFQDYVREAGVGAILVEHVWAQPWMSVFSRMGMHGTSVGGVTVYPTGYPGQGQADWRGLSPDGGRPAFGGCRQLCVPSAHLAGVAECGAGELQSFRARIGGGADVVPVQDVLAQGLVPAGTGRGQAGAAEGRRRRVGVGVERRFRMSRVAGPPADLDELGVGRIARDEAIRRRVDGQTGKQRHCQVKRPPPGVNLGGPAPVGSTERRQY